MDRAGDGGEDIRVDGLRGLDAITPEPLSFGKRQGFLQQIIQLASADCGMEIPPEHSVRQESAGRSGQCCKVLP
ncbi:hypothetical protein JXO59_08365 [candidate division KSB1 bacterium]|nr:hypothetical protein [candidate division KSB1 bacterium]